MLITLSFEKNENNQNFDLKNLKIFLFWKKYWGKFWNNKR